MIASKRNWTIELWHEETDLEKTPDGDRFRTPEAVFVEDI